jgi:hypothetical protein
VSRKRNTPEPAVRRLQHARHGTGFVFALVVVAAATACSGGDGATDETVATNTAPPAEAVTSTATAAPTTTGATTTTAAPGPEDVSYRDVGAHMGETGQSVRRSGLRRSTPSRTPD